VFSSGYGIIFTPNRGEITIVVNYGREETSAVASRSQFRSQCDQVVFLGARGFLAAGLAGAAAFFAAGFLSAAFLGAALIAGGLEAATGAGATGAGAATGATGAGASTL
jgi:hypothetical protein